MDENEELSSHASTPSFHPVAVVCVAALRTPARMQPSTSCRLASAALPLLRRRRRPAAPPKGCPNGSRIGRPRTVPLSPQTAVNRRETPDIRLVAYRTRNALRAGRFVPDPLPRTLLAMQKVVGSNPISRFRKGRHLQVFFVSPVGKRVCVVPDRDRTRGQPTGHWPQKSGCLQGF
jgi:hypothetical protein